MKSLYKTTTDPFRLPYIFWLLSSSYHGVSSPSGFHCFEYVFCQRPLFPNTRLIHFYFHFSAPGKRDSRALSSTRPGTPLYPGGRRYRSGIARHHVALPFLCSVATTSTCFKNYKHSREEPIFPSFFCRERAVFYQQSTCYVCNTVLRVWRTAWIEVHFVGCKISIFKGMMVVVCESIYIPVQIIIYFL